MMKRLALGIVLGWVMIGSAAAEEFFGEFSPGPTGEFISVDPRPVFRLLDEFTFDDPNGLRWATPADFEVDGASIPQIFWSFIGGPFSGKYINASIIHDYYCTVRERTAHDTHRNFYYGMMAAGVPSWQAKAMHWAVASFGPQWRLERRVVHTPVCVEVAGATTCTINSSVESEVVEQPQISLQDPEILAIALAKFNAVARTLRTTEGNTLDITAVGNVDGSLTSIEENAAQLREVIFTEQFRTEPASLGLLSEPLITPASEVAVWPEENLPVYSMTPELDVLDPQERDANSPFRLAPGGVDVLEQNLDLSPSTFEFPSAIQNPN